jgi:glyoxylase-like metal-dependent hydrolase (beta-lactamase superfamily II)
MNEKVMVGNVEIVALLDMVPPPRSPSDFFPDAPSEGWGKYKKYDVLEDGMIQLYYGCFLLRSSGKNVLVDTGIGPGPHPSRGNKKGNLMADLQSFGIMPTHVDLVVHSHLHIDHVGWNLDLSSDPPVPFFPNARYLVPSVDWEYFTRPENLKNAPWIGESVIPLENLSVMDLFDDGFNVTDEITSMITPGHTPGHMVFLIDSAGEKGAVIGDAIHNKVQISEPTWCAGVDTDKSASETSRRELIRRAVSGGYLIAAGHFNPKERFGKITLEDGRHYWKGI